MKQIRNENLWVLIDENLPEAGDAARFVNREDCGAVNLFLRVTRNHEKGRKVTMLYYDCYEEMAIKELHKLILDIQERYPIGKAAVLHKTGVVPVGQTSMIVAIASAHRQEAADATLELIRRLKQDVPIWKKETFENGEAWKEEGKVRPAT